MHIVKFSTLLVKLIHKNSTTVSYQDYTDVQCRNHKHQIPAHAAFPYNKLEIAASYTLLAVLVEKDDERPAWHWWRAWRMNDLETGAQVDQQLEAVIAEKFKDGNG